MLTPVFALQPLRPSIFLAGPTPRSSDVPSWRPQALQLLAEMSFDGDVFVPESADWQPHNDYDGQVNWEWAALNRSTVIAFWVPRELETMPAFTTNVEFGLHVQSGKLVLGYPTGAPKMKYLAELARRHHAPVAHSLEETLRLAVAKALQ